MEDNELERSPLKLILTLLLIVAAPLLLGFYLAPRVLPQPKIGIIRLSYDIFGLTAQEINQQLEYARNDPSIKAVVLIINSPGGSAVYSEELFLDVLSTREKMPVVATIDLLAASGAYYMAAAADEIYAKPTSGVGSIGVIGFLPDDLYIIEEERVTTGPYKSFGGTRDGMMRQMEMAKFAFLEAVIAGRGSRLQVGPELLSRAEIFTGVQAVDMGLIDGLKPTSEVIKRAAALAGVSNYETVELYPLVFPNNAYGGAVGHYQPPPIDAARLWAEPPDLPVGLYFRHVTPANR
jgi:protease IV